MVADLRVSKGLLSAQGTLLLEGIAEWWAPAVAAPLHGLRLHLDAIERIRVASTDLKAWPKRLTVLLELKPGHDANLLAARGEGIPILLGGIPCRRLPEGTWTQPFAVLDERTVLTGDEAVLSELASRNEPQLRNVSIRNMLRSKPFLAPAEARFLIDLNAARAAGWRLPTALLDVWPEASSAWRTLWDTPAGLGVALHISGQLRSNWTLQCESETAAEELRGVFDTLVPLVKSTIATRHASLTLPDGGEPATSRSANGYARFLAEAATALQSLQWSVDGDSLFLNIDWRVGPWPLAAVMLAAHSSLRDDWLSAALVADAEHQQWIGAGLREYQQAEGELPAGAVGGSLLPPETRLSWIAELLPYYGHPDWHRSLRSGYAWNSPQNRGITRRQLDRFVNPALGPSRTKAGYPVTHYVGLAGVGPDAATLPADHPRAGVFGFGRRTRLEDIGDGASNTIAILGVTGDLGAWAAGGHATVRSLTKRPYVNGPDGFGSGQVDGMLAGMADGSVRFISKDIAPEVIESLATINSGSHVTVAALDHTAKPRAELTRPRSSDENPGTPAQPQTPAAVAEMPATDEPARKPLPAIDTVPRLAQRVPEIAMVDVPLGRAVALLAQIGGLPVTFDPEGLESSGASLRDTVSIRRNDATLGTLLEAVLAERGMVYVSEGGQVLVTSPAIASNDMIHRRYTVDDLGADEASLAELAGAVEELIAPASWQSEGGPGSLHAKNGTIEVEQTAATHHRLLVFFEKLRTARGLPLRSRFPVEWFQLATRRSRATNALGRKITATFREPAPLVDILGHLGGLAGADILLDRKALAAEGFTDGEPASVAVADEPFDATLDKLLRPLGLAWRALDANTIQVSTQAALDETMELEFYPVAQLLDGLVTGSTLIEQICTRIAGPTWSDVGGPGAIHYDAKSRHLIVRHNQAVQAAVERLLGEQAGTGR